MRELTTNRAIYRIYSRTWARTKELGMYNESTYKDSNVYIDKKVVDKVDLTKPLNRVSTLPENAKLIFHSTSKFPRHKLELSSYKRKIKENLADYMVGNADSINLLQQTYKYVRAFVTENIIYVTQDDTITKEAMLKTWPELKIIDVLDDYAVVWFTKEQYLYYEYMQGLHTLPIISDEDMNKLIDAKNERITEDVLDSLIDLMTSKSEENIVLGVKLFTQFNLSATPCLTNMFLMMYNDYIIKTNATSSVLYKNLVATYPPKWKSKHNIDKLLEMGFVDDEEKILVSKLVLNFFEPEIKKLIEDANIYIKHLDVKFKYSIVNE